MSEQTDVQKEVTRKLEEADISYMVSGSIASSYYAQPRMTRDINSRSQIQLNDIRSVIKTVKELDWSYIENWGLQLGLKELLNEVCE